MPKIWVAYDHTIHYLVDTDDDSIDQVEIPGWINTFENPGATWYDTGSSVSLDEDGEDRLIHILENMPMPTPDWG